MSDPIPVGDHISEILARRGLTLPADGADPADEAAELVAEMAAMRRESALAYAEQRIPPRWSKARADRDDVLAWVANFLEDPRATPSLLLAGPTGTGKTHQAYGAIRAIAEAGTPVHWIATTSANLYGSLRPRKNVDSEAEFDLYARATLLLLDDLGAAKASEWTEEVTYRLIDHRYAQCLPSIFTTNLPPAELAAGLGDRIASRLIEMTTVVRLTGDDRRRSSAA